MSMLGGIGGLAAGSGTAQASGVARKADAEAVDKSGSRPGGPALANVEQERLRLLISNITRADAAEIIALTQRFEDGPRESASVAMAAYGEASEMADDATSRPFGAPEGGFRAI